MRSHMRTVIVVSLMVGLMWFFLRNADLWRVWEEIRRARWDLLTVGLIVTLGSYLFRVSVGGTCYGRLGRRASARRFVPRS